MTGVEVAPVVVLLTKGVSMSQRLLVVSVALAGCALVSAPPAQAAGEQVKIASGTLEGAVQSGVLSFKGIPFAAPPVGDLRWRAPQPAKPWDGRAAGHRVRPRLRAAAVPRRRRAARHATGRGLPRAQRLAPGGTAGPAGRPIGAAGDGVDLRRRLRQRRQLARGLRRLAVREERRRVRELQLPGRPVRVLRAPGAVEGAARRARSATTATWISSRRCAGCRRTSRRSAAIRATSRCSASRRAAARC